MQSHSTLDMAHKHLRRVDTDALGHARNRLAETGIARLSFLLPYRVRRMLAAEALTVLDHHRQWGERLPEAQDLPRRPVDLDEPEVTAHAPAIPQLYDCESLRDNLSVIAAEPVLPFPGCHRFTVSRAHHDDSAGQWHWEQHAFTLVLIVECPPLEEGGFVQTVAHTDRDWDHHDVYRTLTRNPIHSWELHPGDLYLMRTDTTLHRVHPFTHGRRTVLAMTFASRANLEQTRDAIA
ncbi:hypothetical protein [Nocardia sp. NBC_00511]|uniref:HalD/BesD family halogenase n=1 Tax=Nocardia sp. NBC_00511 TaxID=2903591 RepID=UPI0030E4E116